MHLHLWAMLGHLSLKEIRGGCRGPESAFDPQEATLTDKQMGVLKALHKETLDTGSELESWMWVYSDLQWDHM